MKRLNLHLGYVCEEVSEVLEDRLYDFFTKNLHGPEWTLEYALYRIKVVL